MIEIALHITSILLLLTILLILLSIILRINKVEVEGRRKGLEGEVGKNIPPPIEDNSGVISGSEIEEFKAIGHLDTIEEQEWREEQKRTRREIDDL